MRFCPKCKSVLWPSGEKNKLVCKRCGYEKLVSNISIKISSGKRKTAKEIVIFDSTQSSRLPTTNIECPKCNNETAYWWFVQTRRADEPPTTFYRCTKCNHTWRDYR